MKKTISLALFSLMFLFLFSAFGVGLSLSPPACEDYPARVCSSSEPVEEGTWVKYTGYTLESEGRKGFPGVCAVNEDCWVNLDFNHKKYSFVTEKLPIIIFGVLLLGIVFGLYWWRKTTKQKDEELYRTLGVIYTYLVALASPIAFGIVYLLTSILNADFSATPLLFVAIFIVIALVSFISLLIKKSSWAARILSFIVLIITLLFIAAVLFRAG